MPPILTPTSYPPLNPDLPSTFAADEAFTDAFASGGLFKIAEQTAGVGGLATFDFQSIPQTFKDLRLIVNGRATAAATFDAVTSTVNNDSTDANYRSQGLQSANTTSTAAQNLGTSAAVRQQAFLAAAQATSGDFGDVTIDIPCYSKTDRTKILTFTNSVLVVRTSGGILLRRAMLAWLSTAAITRLTLAPATGGAVFAEGSVASLYGIRSSFG